MLDAARDSVKCELLRVTAGMACEELREAAVRVVCGDAERPRWGSLARGTILVLLSGTSSAARAGACLELVHHGSLVVDDVVDHAVSRRGGPSLWCDISLERAVLVSHALVTVGLEGLAHHPAVGGAVQKMIAGEVRGFRLPVRSREEYLDRAVAKTGALYSCVAAIAAAGPLHVLADVAAAAVALCDVGVAHQVADDIADAEPTDANRICFESQAYARLNEQQSVWATLPAHASTRDRLIAWHRRLADDALARLAASLRETPAKPFVLELAHAVARGSLAVSAPRVGIVNS